MVFGNLGANSGTGVAFTHDPATGERGIYGGYLPTSKVPAIWTMMIWCARCTGGCPRTDRYATSGRARRTTSAAASHFTELFAAMDGLPTTIRLLDPPLHKFLPDLTVRVRSHRNAGIPTLRRSNS
jgi:phosphoenolpyruvate synthase/pyruvate phosphate dikinase